MSYLRRAFHEYAHALKPRHIASMQLAIALHTGDEYVRRSAAHFSTLAGPLQIELAMIERQLTVGSVLTPRYSPMLRDGQLVENSR
jgi:hypothetical protein